MIMAAIILSGRAWLDANPQSNPWAPLDLRQPAGWASPMKLAALRNDVGLCREALERSDIAFDALEPASGGNAACARPDRTVLTDYPLSPRRPAATCPLNVGLYRWLDQSVNPAARDLFDQEVTGIRQIGVYNCRRLYGRDFRWLERTCNWQCDRYCRVRIGGRANDFGPARLGQWGGGGRVPDACSRRGVRSFRHHSVAGIQRRPSRSLPSRSSQPRFRQRLPIG